MGSGPVSEYSWTPQYLDPGPTILGVLDPRSAIKSATDVGWAPSGGDKDNKEENDVLAWKAWPLKLEQRDFCRAS